MQLSDWLASNIKLLDTAGDPTSRLDLLVLLEDATGKDRGWLLANPQLELKDAVAQCGLTNLAGLNRMVRRRAKHEPLAYIRSKSEFYRREFYIDRRVLEPRPESETMIDLLKKYNSVDKNFQRKMTVVDVGCGSGALGITAVKEIADCHVIAIDIDPGCLEVTNINSAKHGVSLEVLKGNLLSAIHDQGTRPTETVYILLCNLPYVPDDFQINDAALLEPRTAIFGGPDGIDIYRELFDQAKDFSPTPRLIMTESLPPQHEALTSVARAAGFKLLETDDFIQVFSSSEPFPARP
jgi:release factor glutamine methyltransferase